MAMVTAMVTEKLVLLHGDLDLEIIEARCLPNMDLFSEHFRRVVACAAAPLACVTSLARDMKKQPHPQIHHFKDQGDGAGSSRKNNNNNNNNSSSRRHLSFHKKIITSDPYVTVSVGGAIVARTRVIKNCEEPKWNEHFDVPLAHRVYGISFTVKDNDFFGADLIGSATISAARIAAGDEIDDWFQISGPTGRIPRRGAAIHLRLRFLPCGKNPAYERSIPGGEHGVKRSYFPVRPGGSLTLYQDAHVREGEVPKVELEDGVEYNSQGCWEDICHAILEAHSLIYIVGWSIFHKVKLVRESTRGRELPSAGELTLGDLLRHKSEEGVRVLVLVWDDKTSHSNAFINTTGVMQTHDEETRKFFKHSSVICTMSPRYASSKLSIFKQYVVGTLYTHHQKCVIVDTQGPGNTRKITSFLGGLDLCDGRYDTPSHRLYSDLDTVFQGDYHNPILLGSKGPREPWHDLHCKIEGPAAYDVLTNFEQRWKKATKWSLSGKLKSMSHFQDDALLKIDRISWILSPNKDTDSNDPKLWVCDEKDPESWHVQIFRSIDSGSVIGFPKDVQKAESQNLVCAKDLIKDKSIQTAYIEAIRSAQHFIYIENQYFLGSSYNWPDYKVAGAEHLIPMELTLKIISKIRANERFAVYILIPMWPEGDTNSASVQEILYWQGQTRQMMYRLIAQAIQDMKLDSHPRDYLNFYCLGNREPPLESSASNQNGSNNGDVMSPSEKYRRFMVYVHAKGMIVDDELVILGSANINERSMSGSRDTEIAMGAYQPHHTWGRKNGHPYGQVYGYRMSLWAEHLGCVEDTFKEAQSLKCVNTVNEVAEENWRKYVANEYSPLQGHLLPYPIGVSKDGKVSALPGFDEFPDVGGKVLGEPSTTIFDALTT